MGLLFILGLGIIKWR